MTASTANALSWRLALAEALDGNGHAWLFVAKAAGAVLLTGWIAMRVGLQSPGTAMLTCAIVINPQSGMVLAKSFYRAIGTLIGCLAAVALVASFPQSRNLLLLGMALWLGLCAGGASLHRNFKSYGFVLSGYTAAIIALPVLNHPAALFDSALMRTSEVMLGILVAGVISDAIAPQRLSRALRDSIRKQFTGFIGFVGDSLTGTPARQALEQAHLRFVREVVQIENLRSSVIFEDAGVRVRSPRTRRLNQRFMATSSTWQSLHHLMNRLQGEQHAPARHALQTLHTRVADSLDALHEQAPVADQASQLHALLGDLHAPLRAQADKLRLTLPTPAAGLDFDTGAQLLLRFVAELQAYARAYTDLAGLTMQARGERAETGFRRGNDWLGAALVTLRTSGVMLVTGAFWIATAWPGGAEAMLIATIFCGLMASRPNPANSVRIMWKGWMIGGLAAALCLFGVLAHMDGFALFAAGLAPFLMAGFYPYTRPALVPMARAAMLAFLILLEPAAVLHFSMPAFANRTLGFLFGVGATGVAFLLFANAADNRWLYRRLVAKLRAQVARACRAPLGDARPRLESASRDLSLQIIGYTRPGSDTARELLAWSLSVHEVGRALLDLRAASQHASPGLRRRVDYAVGAMQRLYQAPDRYRYVQARRRVQNALRAADDAQPVRQNLHLLRLVLLDDASILAQSTTVAEPALGKEATHAA